MNITNEILAIAAVVDQAHWVGEGREVITGRMHDALSAWAKTERGWQIDPGDLVLWENSTDKSRARGQLHVYVRWTPQRLELIRGPRDGERLAALPGAHTLNREGNPPERLMFRAELDYAAIRVGDLPRELPRPDEYTYLGIDTDSARLIYQFNTPTKASTP